MASQKNPASWMWKNFVCRVKYWWWILFHFIYCIEYETGFNPKLVYKTSK